MDLEKYRKYYDGYTLKVHDFILKLISKEQQYHSFELRHIEKLISTLDNL